MLQQKNSDGQALLASTVTSDASLSGHATLDVGVSMPFGRFVHLLRHQIIFCNYWSSAYLDVRILVSS